MKLLKLLMLMSLFVSGQALAKTFTSQYMEFQLPVGWDCQIAGSEYVCQSEDKNRQKEAIIILAAKKRGSQDTLDNYKAYLGKSKSFVIPGGKKLISEPRYAKLKEIKKHRWIDALHMASEVPGFYTRYLATIKEDLGVAITFSVSKDHYDVYKDVFDRIIDTLKVFRLPSGNAGKYELASGRKKENLLDEDTTLIPDLNSQINTNLANKNIGRKSGISQTDLIVYGGAAAIVGLLILFRMKSAKKKKRSKKRRKKT